jgi:hypothetical protein
MTCRRGSTADARNKAAMASSLLLFHTSFQLLIGSAGRPIIDGVLKQQISNKT